MARFLKSLEQRRPNLGEQWLTAFQEEVYRKCLVPEAEIAQNHPFLGDNHLILAGPTSCGKSTVAEIFLLRQALASDRRGALYIAPTRALAQQKHRDLRELTQGEAWANEIYVSTGDDRQADSMIANGRFRIACMVYEKANILFSRNARFLTRVGCIVIDEFHMLGQSQRGPLLELALAKATRDSGGAARQKRNRPDWSPSRPRAPTMATSAACCRAARRAAAR